MNLPRGLTTSADDGLPDAALESALRAWAHASGDARTEQDAVVEAFRLARVYVPAVAPERDKLGLIALRREDGLTALPIFTSIERLIGWRPEARPLPHIGSVVAAMAHDDRYAVVVLDIDGPISATLPVPSLTV